MSATMLSAGLLLPATPSAAQPGKQADEKLITSARSAGPKSVALNATVVAMEADGTLRTLRQGRNGFTCIPDDPASPGRDPMCLNTNGMEWRHTWMNKTLPPDKVGIVFMLVTGGDVSNTDPFATKPEAGRRWISTGPHMMVVGGPAVNATAGYPRTPDPDPGKPFMMWIGTPYEHAMIPIR
ncbi:hypothetical protein E2C06_16255 [Dankookia rubra]|uniref:Uncharacterized protein n=1 Tax=Dankookia rubra TaxID=1442381 RepID=A0A4V3AA33_9PROT|nr:hypothetical protein E2C06_16255 [Dankookia rubra]